jgi:hypothetical protein
MGDEVGTVPPEVVEVGGVVVGIVEGIVVGIVVEGGAAPGRHCE